MYKYLIIGFCFITLLGCKKNPSDYRSKYVGDYIFTIDYTSWNPLGGQVDTLYTFNGNVKYGSDKNSVLIFFSTNISLESTIYEDGTLNVDIYSYDTHFLGEFESTKRIKFYYGNSWPGGHFNYNVNGEKK